MKEIFQEILKQEEVASGFIPGEPDDDTFLLEQQQYYPIDIPDFSDDEVIEETLPEVETESVAEVKVDETIYDVPQEGSVWDIFDETKQVQQESVEQPDSEIESFDDEEIASLNTEGMDFDELSSLANENSDEYLFANEVELVEEDLQTSPQVQPEEELQIDQLEEIESEAAEPIELEAIEPEPAKEEEISFDADFLSSLKGDLEKSTKTKNETKDDVQPIADEKPLFEADDKSKDELFIDISALDYDKPSTVGKQSEEQTKPVQEPKSAELNNESTEKVVDKKTAKDKKDKEAKKEKPKKEKKERKKLPIFNIIKYAAIFLLFSTLGLGGYYAWDKYSHGLFEKSEEIAHKEEVHKEEPAKKVEPKKEEIAEHKETVLPDTNESSKKEEAAEPKIEVVKETPKEQPKVAEAPKEIPVKVIPKQVVPKPIKQEAKPIAKQRNEVAVERPIKPAKERKEIAKAVDKPVEQKVVATNTIEPQKEVYTVQIYSSPSLEDAEAWLKQLASKSIQGGYISPQKVRDQTWYRVRFGYFSNREEARSAASKYGFSQSWIDRIK